jgi:hypothetical protein
MSAWIGCWIERCCSLCAVNWNGLLSAVDSNRIVAVCSDDLAKLRAIKIGSVWKLTEITKKERIVLEKMRVAIPIKLKHGY